MVAPGQPIDPRITFTRASTATYFNSAGVLTSAGNNVARLDYNPTTLASRGLLIEEQRTNSIRNNTMQGAVAGTPGTLPTNWSSATIGGLTREILGVGTESGITYIDVRISGTTTGAVNGSSLVIFESSTQVAAASGQTWTASSYVKLQAGSFANTTGCDIRVDERDVAGVFLIGSQASISTATSAALSTQRFSITRTFTNVSTAYANARLAISANSGVAIDITLRIGLPQLEQGAFATSVIPTTTTALTRNADAASITGANFSSWFNQSQSTMFVDATFGNGIGATAQALFSISDGGETNRFISYRTSTTVWQVDEAPGGGVVSTTAASNLTTYRSAVALAVNDMALVINGGSPSTDSTVTLSTKNQMAIGDRATGGRSLNGHIRRITYYPRRLSNAELQAITA